MNKVLGKRDGQRKLRKFKIKINFTILRLIDNGVDCVEIKDC